MFDTDLDDVLDVVAGGLHDGVEDVPGVVGQDDGEHRDQAEGEGDLGEDLDAVLQAGEHGQRGDDGHEADDESACSKDHGKNAQRSQNLPKHRH